jgi:hypothetical protein
LIAEGFDSFQAFALKIGRHGVKFRAFWAKTHHLANILKGALDIWGAFSDICNPFLEGV